MNHYVISVPEAFLLFPLYIIMAAQLSWETSITLKKEAKGNVTVQNAYDWKTATKK
jgi:hypothetical protein